MSLTAAVRRSGASRAGSSSSSALAATLFGIVALAVLLFTVAGDGFGRLSWDFINSYPSRFPERAGIQAALFGTLWMMGLTALFAIPLGVGAAIYLEEFAPRNWITKIIETNINNLAGVPSIIYGLLGLTIFVRVLVLGRSVLAGALTMSLLVLPIIIVASREGLRAVPPSIREGVAGPRRHARGRRCASRSCRRRCPACLPASSSRSPARSARRRR